MHTTRRWLLALVVVGLGWRIGRYLLGFPLWGDEAFIACGVASRGYSELFSQPPEYFQIAPLLFLWIERFAFETLGPSEYVLRLQPLVAGCAALLLFAHIARDWFEPRAAVLATGIFAVAYPVVRAATEVKPYAGDGLVSVLILWAVLHWLRAPERWSRAVLLTLIAVVGVWLSFPAILLAGGVGIGLLFLLERRHWPALFAYGVVVSASFAVNLFAFAQAQMHRSAGSWLERYWAAGFPDLGQPLDFPRWFIHAHASQMMGYPIGGNNYGSTGPAILFAIGIFVLVRRGQGRFAALLLAPFGVSIVAAIAHRYPYGVAPRLAQHLAPAICLLIGAGTAALVSFLATSRARERITAAVAALMMLVAAGGFALDIATPYKAPEDRSVRALATQLRNEIPRGAEVVLLNPRETSETSDQPPQFLPTVRYYLQANGYRLLWCADAPIPPTAGWIITYHVDGLPPQRADVEARLAAAGLRVVDDAHRLQDTTAKKGLEVFRCAPR